YHLLTGQEPPSAMVRFASTDPLRPPRTHNPNLSIHVSNALMKAMSLRLEDRFAREDELEMALMNRAPTVQQARAAARSDPLSAAPAPAAPSTFGQGYTFVAPAPQPQPIARRANMKKRVFITYDRSPNDRSDEHFARQLAIVLRKHKIPVVERDFPAGA